MYREDNMKTLTRYRKRGYILCSVLLPDTERGDTTFDPCNGKCSFHCVCLE